MRTLAVLLITLAASLGYSQQPSCTYVINSVYSTIFRGHDGVESVKTRLSLYSSSEKSNLRHLALIGEVIHKLEFLPTVFIPGKGYGYEDKFGAGAYGIRRDSDISADLCANSLEVLIDNPAYKTAAKWEFWVSRYTSTTVGVREELASLTRQIETIRNKFQEARSSTNAKSSILEEIDRGFGDWLQLIKESQDLL